MATCVPKTHTSLASGDIWNEKKENLPSLSLAKPRDNVEVAFKMYRLFTFGGFHCQFILCKCVINSYIIFSTFYCTWSIENYTEKIMHLITRMHIHYSSQILNFILPTYWSNFVEFTCTPWKFEQACSRLCLSPFRLKTDTNTFSEALWVFSTSVFWQKSRHQSKMLQEATIQRLLKVHHQPCDIIQRLAVPTDITYGFLMEEWLQSFLAQSTGCRCTINVTTLSLNLRYKTLDIRLTGPHGQCKHSVEKINHVCP
jgi:hypothetical protein